MHTYVKKLKDWAKHSPAVFAATVIVVIISSMLTVWKGGNELLGAAIDLAVPKKSYYEMADKVATDVRIQYLESVLGTAQIKNSVGPELEEYIFINDYFYTQALVKNEQVLMYSITTRHPRFNPEVKGAVLGKTRFAELDEIKRNELTEIQGGLGARRLQYWETYWGGNPSEYQLHIYSLNDAVLMASGYQGFPVGDTSILEDVNFKYSQPTAESKKIFDPRLDKFRQETAINTVSVTSPSFVMKEAPLNFGPDNDQVRIVEKSYYR